MSYDTGSILLRRGPTADRLAFVPLTGEIIYDTDNKKVYVGDGVEYGGIEVTHTGYTKNVYYVTTEGSDINDGDTIDTAFATIKKACEVAGAIKENPHAERLITENLNWLTEEMYQWMLYQKANTISPFSPASVFDQTKTYRDAEIVAKAIAHDISRGGNHRTVAATWAYFRMDEINTFYSPSVAAQMPYFIAALTRLKTLILTAISNTALVTSYQTLNNVPTPIAQYIDLDRPAEAGTDTLINNLFDILLPALTAQDTSNIPRPYTGTNATIHIKTGTYYEQLPIVVPENTAILGDSIRNTFVEPKAGNSDDGVTPNNQSTMFQLSDGAIVKNIGVKGMTGFAPSLTDPTNINAATIGGIFFGFNPDSPIVNKSPYIIECSGFSSGGIGVVVDGSIHNSGYKSMVFHGYTNIQDNGIGFWIKDGGIAEIVSCFTYYAYMGYVSSGGGIIRSLNGNNSYGTYGAVSYGYDVNENTVTGQLEGLQLIYDPETLVGSFNTGNLVIGATSGAQGTITYTSAVYNKLHYTPISGSFINGEGIINGIGATATLTASGVSGQKGFTLAVSSLTEEPIPGGSVEFVTGDTGTYVIQNVLSWNPATSKALLVLANEKGTASPNNSAIRIRYKYSQARLTGHDFLRIGTGGMETTNFPGVPLQAPSQGNEIIESHTGRVYYISTDQDGNFRVGNYFRINQSTGVATLNTSAFDLSGLNTLNVAAFGGISGETINEFSADATLSANSNLKVPTEAAIKQYFTQIATNVNPSVNNTYDLGSTSKKWKTLNVGTVNTTALNINSGSIVFEGATDDAFETTLAVVDPTADRTITFPDATTTVVGTDTTQTLTNKTLTSPTFTGTAQGENLTLTGNLTISGTTTTVNTTNTSYTDGILELHNTVSGGPHTTDDGKDIGLRMHYFKTSDKNAFLGWANDTGYLEYYSDATETSGVITGTYGSIKANSFISTVATGTAPFTVASTTKVDNLYAARAALADAVTNGVYTTDTGSVTNAMLAGSIANNKLAYSSITVNGQIVSLGGTVSITAESPASLTIGTGLSGTSYNGSSPTTIAIDNTVALRADETYIGTTAVALNRASGALSLAGVSIDGSAASLSGNVTAKYFYAGPTSGSATTATWRAITASDIPTLNQNTSGSAGSATKATNLVGGNSTTLLGSIPYQSNTDTTTLLAPNTTTTKKFLVETGDGTNGAAPSWGTIATGDIPAHYIGTTSITFNRASANQALTGISSIALPGSTSGAITIQSVAVAGSNVISFPAVTGTVVTTGDTGSVTNGMLSGSIANSKLTNSSITIGSTTFNLGDTKTSVTGLTNLSSTAAATSPFTIETGATTTLDSGTMTVRSGAVTVGAFSSGPSLFLSGDSAGNSGAVYLKSGTATLSSGGVLISSGQGQSSSGDVNITTGFANATGGIRTSGNIVIYAGSCNGATGTKTGGSVYIDGGAPQSGGTTTIGSVYIGTRYVELAYGTQSVSIGRAGITTTIDGTLQTTTITSGSAATAGTITGAWTLNGTWQATYADLAEKYVADADYEPGTVLELGGEFEVTLAEDETRRVAGIVTTNPYQIMNADCQGDHVVAIALQGRVPCKVRGIIKKGDMLVSAGGGFARASNNPIYGSVIGKAISNFDGGEGVVEVLVGRM